jgi:glycosyltransferase involved in cell wall biosynthesis
LLAGVPTSSRIHAWRYAVRQQRDALVTRDWLRRRIADGLDASSSTLYYTYWLTPVTAGIVTAMRERRKEARSRIVSRAHRYDLYEAPEHRVQNPARRRLLQGLSRLYLISKHGLTYVTGRYPGASHYELARLGVPDPLGLARPSVDGVLRVVSCSFVVPVKRVELLYAALGELAARHAGAIEWTHIGDGPQFQALKELTGSAPANLTVRLLGRRSNAEVIAEYLSRPVDVFVNVSSSEGIPVAIMEAQSCGIPVVATQVGGMAEIVSEAVGVLLPANPATADIASAIERMGPWHRDAAARRAASRENWQRHFFADANYEAFARSLCEMTS